MTRPPGDSWTPPSTLPASAPAIDAWSRPVLNSDSAADRNALARASAQLNTWLGVLLVVLVVGAVASALAVFLGGRAGLNALSTPGSGVSFPGYTNGLLGLAALLTLVWAAIYLGLVNWARELLKRLASWALSSPDLSAPGAPAPDAVRTEQLRRTLSGWLTFGQWGTVAGVVFSAALVPITLVLTRRLTEQYAPGSGSDLAGFGPAYQTVQTVSSLLSSVPDAVIVWLILGAIRRFMNLVVGRARGLATGPVTPAAKVVGNWFVLCMVLLGVALLNLLVVGVALAVLLPLAQQDFAVGIPESWHALLGLLIRGMVGFLLFAALVYGLYFALLVFSRSYALAMGRLLDAGTASRVPTPPTMLPTGSAGDKPNIYKGYQ
ncbi:hypothetical protein Q0M94_01365 [Deinococcus radiomollis]|uniref:hypothetical protein n=1 Tax=Deinococcus radiomollis TaxID=468916 RepID=UPI0038923843